MERLLHRLAGLILRHRGWLIYPQLGLFVLCVVFAVSKLEFRTDPNELFSADEGYLHHWMELRKEFQVQEDLVTLVESEDLEKNRQFVERLAARLESESEVFENVFYKGDLQALGSKGLLFLPEQRLEQLLTALREYEPLIHTFSGVSNLSSLFLEVDARVRASPEAEAVDHPLLRAVPALRKIVDQGVESIQRPGIPPSPGFATLFGGGEEPTPGEYLHLAAGRFYIVGCTMAAGVPERVAIQRLREWVTRTQMEVPGVNVGVTGTPVLRSEEMTQARRDTTLASWVALAVVAFTFIFCYHEVWRPLKATACLLVGIGYTLGFATLAVGHLNLLTITFIPILIGLAIDFGVHLITRFEEELRRGRSARMAMDKALVVSGTGICTSGLITAVAFLAMTLTQFKGIREMGLISGVGLLLCLVPMMTLLPALLMQGRSRAQLVTSSRSGWSQRREQIEQLWLRRPRLVAGVGFGLTVLAAAQLFRLEFDYNVLNLQSQGLTAVQYERKLTESSTRSVLACLITADSLGEAIRLEQRLRGLETVSEVHSIAPLLVENQERKLALVRAIRDVAQGIQLADGQTGPVELPELDEALRSFNQMLGAVVYTLGQSSETEWKAEVAALRDSLTAWRDAIVAGGYNTGRKLTHYQSALFRDLAATLAALQAQDADRALRIDDLPAALRGRFVGRTGKFLLHVYPRENVWERAAQEAYVQDLRTVDPGVMGSPVRAYEYTRQIKGSFQRAALYALLGIVVMLISHFRNIVCALLALIPVLVGMLWTAGAMAWFGLSFNPANIISISLLIGIGVSSGVHILQRFTEEQHPSILGKSTGKAVLVSALTTAIGFGSLMLARHEGIASLGRVMALGTVLCMLAALMFLPALLLLLKQLGLKLAHGWLSH